MFTTGPQLAPAARNPRLPAGAAQRPHDARRAAAAETSSGPRKCRCCVHDLRDTPFGAADVNVGAERTQPRTKFE